jgi:Urm1 (Ubiquitin related modifier)
MLFANKNKHSVSIPAKDLQGLPVNIKYLVGYICQNLMQDSRKELFVVDDAVYCRFPHKTYKTDREADDLEFWSSSTTRTGNLKVKKSTSWSTVITFYLSLHCMVDEDMH